MARVVVTIQELLDKSNDFDAVCLLDDMRNEFCKDCKWAQYSKFINLTMCARTMIRGNKDRCEFLKLEEQKMLDELELEEKLIQKSW